MRKSHFHMIEADKKNDECYKTSFFFEQDGISAYTTFIRWDEYRLQIVHFVSGRDGNEYGQFITMEEAIEKARFMVSIPKDERRKYDQ